MTNIQLIFFLSDRLLIFNGIVWIIIIEWRMRLYGILFMHLHLHRSHDASSIAVNFQRKWIATKFKCSMCSIPRTGCEHNYKKMHKINIPGLSCRKASKDIKNWDQSWFTRPPYAQPSREKEFLSALWVLMALLQVRSSLKGLERDKSLGKVQIWNKCHLKRSTYWIIMK